MGKIAFLMTLLAAPISGFAQPNIGDLLRLNESIVHVSVDLGNGSTGTGTGVVVSNEYVATNSTYWQMPVAPILQNMVMAISRLP